MNFVKGITLKIWARVRPSPTWCKCTLRAFVKWLSTAVAYYENYIWMATYHQVQPQVNILHLTFYYNCHFMLNVHPADFFTCCIKYHPPPPPPPKCPGFYYLDISISWLWRIIIKYKLFMPCMKVRGLGSSVGMQREAIFWCCLL